MDVVLPALAPVFLLIALGFGVRQRAFREADHWALVDRINYFILFPALLAHTLGTAALDFSAVWRLSLSLLGGLFTMIAVVALLRPFLGLPGAAFTSVFQGAVRWNGFVALALGASLLSAADFAFMAVAIATLVPVINVICVIVLSRNREGTPAPLTTLPHAVATNPLIIACALGLVLNGWAPLWDGPVGETVAILGRASLALGLLAVGAALDFDHLRGKTGIIILTIALKLVAMPAIMGAWAWGMGVSGPALVVAVVCGAMPGATSSYVLARQLGGDAPLMAGLTTASTLAAALTLPVVLLALS